MVPAFVFIERCKFCEVRNLRLRLTVDDAMPCSTLFDRDDIRIPHEREKNKKKRRKNRRQIDRQTKSKDNAAVAPLRRGWVGTSRERTECTAPLTTHNPRTLQYNNC